ncbi:hypothetical protein E4T56_gene9821 [Termitomyces sp. T112]|nr:hypothetical protein E4T56_gene9821 [Termitomyces sp. T112]KAH0578486.1 hypothetical protein H2248_003629 [Termitomyces sp. 'cryptogamus']KNZ81070.1 hypothetical protein J132_03060 [Termitomyces sp. J132]
MYFITFALVSAFFFLQLALLVDAGIYVIKPEANSTCHGGQRCTIQWLDDGIRPLLAAAGVCTFGLYTGTMQLVQTIPPVDVSATRSISFKPIPAAGPNSDSYYIGIISITAKENSSESYEAFSPFFSIDQMTGSFDSPLSEATSTIPITSSVFSRSTTHLSTITVGTLLTSLPPLPTVAATTTASISSQTRFTTKSPSLSPSTPIPTSVASKEATSFPSATSSKSNGVVVRVPPMLALTVAALGLFLFPLLLSLF